MTLDLRQLRHVLALAEHGSFGRAAAALHMTQPALSRSVKVLEEQIGAELFERSSTGVTPTDDGRLLIPRAQALVQAADELDREVRRRRAPGSGQLVVGAGPYPGDTIVPVALTRFVVAHPLVRVRVLIRGDWDELLRRLRSREFDFFVAETSTLEGENDLDIEPLSPHPAYFVVRREHPLVRRSAVRAEHTFQYPFVALSRYPPRILAPMLASRRGADAARPQRPFPAVELTSLAAMKRILASSDAVAALTLPCVRDEVTHGTLVVLGTEPWAVSRYGLVRLKGLAPSKHAAQFRDCLIDAEAELVREEAQLIGRLAPRGAPRSREAKARPSRASRKIRK